MVNLVNSVSLLRIALFFVSTFRRISVKAPQIFFFFQGTCPRNYFLRVHTTGDQSQGPVAGTSPLVCAGLKETANKTTRESKYNPINLAREQKPLGPSTIKTNQQRNVKIFKRNKIKANYHPVREQKPFEPAQIKTVICKQQRNTSRGTK